MPTLTVDEHDRSFNSLGASPRWVTIMGGEPTLRIGRTEIVEILGRHRLLRTIG